MNKKKILYKVPILGFLLIISLGTFILELPICNNKELPFIDALFVSTSGVCITGYTTVVLSEQFTFIGQIFLLFLVQIGALGFMTFIIFTQTVIKRKISFSETLLLEDGDLNSNFKEKTKMVIKYTFFIETIGSIFLSFRFIKIYGLGKGIWNSVFHSVTAFCNSGFDIIGKNSFEPFTNDIYINIILMSLIILGGIGFLVLDNILDIIKKRNTKKLSFQSKIVLLTTFFLLMGSVIYIKLMEPKLTLLQSMFTAVTLRTAGFSTINMANCNQATKMLGVILMFIGGAPGSTAGGIRVVTFAVLILAMISTIKNRQNVIIFFRKINEKCIMKAITITGWSFFAVFVGVIIMSFFNNLGLENIIFHCVGAFSDTGLGIIPSNLLNIVGKVTIMALMFIGRIGPIVAFRVFFDTEEKMQNIKFPDGELYF